MALFSQALHLGYLLSPHSAFQGHAAHTARWPTMLSPNGSSDTCISDGVFHIPMPCFHGALPVYPKVVTTFLHNASRRTRRAMHASCASPWHSLAKRTRLGGLLPPQVAFQEHAAHPPRWPGELSSKGSSDTCISDSVSTFLYRAFTAHGPHLVGIHPRFTLSSLEAGFNADASFDDPCQFPKRRLLELHLGHPCRCEVILVAIPSVLIHG